MKKHLQNLALFICSLILIGFICEGMFLWLNGFSSPPQIETFESMPNEERLDFFHYHPVYGYSGLPSIRKEFYRKYNANISDRKYITHNSRGFRGPEVEYEKAKGVKRVAFIGDSQTWGWAVSDDETIAYYAGELLNRRSKNSSTYEPLNFGATGYGVDQSYLRFIAEGLRYQPDYVVFTYFAENDIDETSATESWGVEKPYMYEKEGGGFCVSNVPPRRASGWPSDNLAFIVENKFNIKNFKFKIGGLKFDLTDTQTVKYFKNRSINTTLFGGWGSDNSNAFSAIRKHVGCLEDEPGPPPLSWQDKINLVVKLIHLIHKTVTESGAEFFVVTKPHEDDYKRNRRGDDYLSVLTQLQRKSINLIDMYSVAKAKNMAAERLFIAYGHLSPAGNKLVAESVVEKILETGAAGTSL
ncbi:MAG TPA: SGNH/GDSL hydrolase family protein [Gammaproteobacteria bacterium]